MTGSELAQFPGTRLVEALDHDSLVPTINRFLRRNRLVLAAYVLLNLFQWRWLSFGPGSAS